MNNMRSTVRESILRQTKPFCISDIYFRLEKITKDRELILQVLDELYEEQLLDYVCINREKHLWAFVVK